MFPNEAFKIGAGPSTLLGSRVEDSNLAICLSNLAIFSDRD